MPSVRLCRTPISAAFCDCMKSSRVSSLMSFVPDINLAELVWRAEFCYHWIRRVEGRLHSSPFNLFTLNASFEEANARDYDALMIAGGRAPEYLRLNPKVIELIQQFAKDGKPIAAVCHGAQLLAAADFGVSRMRAGSAASGWRVCGHQGGCGSNGREFHHSTGLACSSAMAGAVPCLPRHENRALSRSAIGLRRQAVPGERSGAIRCG
jgi:hypothetical protein